MDDTATLRKIGAHFADLRPLIKALRLPAEDEFKCIETLNMAQMDVDMAFVSKPADATQLVAVIEDDGQPE